MFSLETSHSNLAGSFSLTSTSWSGFENSTCGAADAQNEGLTGWFIHILNEDKTTFSSTHVRRLGSRRFWSLLRHKCTSLSRPECSRGWPALSCGRRQSSHTSWSCGSPVRPGTIAPPRSLWKLHTRVWRWLPLPPSGPPEASWTPPLALNTH